MDFICNLTLTNSPPQRLPVKLQRVSPARLALAMLQMLLTCLYMALLKAALHTIAV